MCQWKSRADDNFKQLLQLSMVDGPLILRVNLPVVDTIHPKKNKFAMDVKVYQKAMMVLEIYFSSKVVYTR